MIAAMPDDESAAPGVDTPPELPTRETLAAYLGKMLLARGSDLPEHGEPWQLVQVTEPSETGTVNEEPISDTSWPAHTTRNVRQPPLTTGVSGMGPS